MVRISQIPPRADPFQVRQAASPPGGSSLITTGFIRGQLGSVHSCFANGLGQANPRRRALLQRMTERLDALRVGRAAERARLEEGREPDRLVLRWAELSDVLEQRRLR